MDAPQLPKMQGKSPETWAAQVVDTLNPALRAAFFAGAFRWSEVEGANGAAPTFALQVAGRGGTWTTIASLDVTGQIMQPAWTAPAFLNSWVNFNAAYMPAAYMKDAQGFVRLRGLVKNGTINTAAFVLPVGYRPSFNIQFPSLDGVNAAGLVQIDTAGNVVPQIGNNAVYRLDGISFDVRA